MEHNAYPHEPGTLYDCLLCESDCFCDLVSGECIHCALLAEEDPEADEASNTISEQEALERFDDFLNEVHPTVTVCGYDYDPARALKELDPTAYREEFNNWLDSEGLELE